MNTTFSRLSPEDTRDVIRNLVDYRMPDAAGPEDRAAFAAGCEVIYKDDYETGCSWFQVVDAQGHGDGSGEWTPVEA